MEVASLLDVEEHPGLVHLVSTVTGVLRPEVGWAELLAAAFPPGSVTGAPKSSALRLIADLEPVPRGWYCGTVGWVDADGNGTWAVAIRCAELSEDRRSARLIAGGGIVADSEPLAELAETQAKFQAMLSAIVRP